MIKPLPFSCSERRRKYRYMMSKCLVSSLTLFDGSRSSTSKFDVSLGLFTTGMYGAVAKSTQTQDLHRRSSRTNLVEGLPNRWNGKTGDDGSPPIRSFPTERRSNREDAVTDLWRCPTLEYRSEMEVTTKTKSSSLFSKEILDVSLLSARAS